MAHDKIRDFTVSRFKTFKKAFHTLDVDKSGYVSKKEFVNMLKLGNLPIRDQTMFVLAGIYDKNNNGTIDYKEFTESFLSANAIQTALSQEAKSGYVDHSLEMWRSGHAMGRGGNVGHSHHYDKGYKFDGKVDNIGEGDTDSPPTMAEIERAHDQIRDYATTRWATFRKGFNNLDVDRSGKVSKVELLRLLMHANLPIREKVMSALADLYDTNQNGLIDFSEFSMALSQGDAAFIGNGVLANVNVNPVQKGRHIYVPKSGVMYRSPEDLPVIDRVTHHFEPGDGPAYAHVDQSLEMFREGRAAGGGRGQGLADGSRYDGNVSKVGEGDKGPPPTMEEMERAHDQIRNYAQTKFESFRNAFRKLDEDGSGTVTKLEFLRILMMANLQIREKTIAALVNVYDKNNSGDIDYNEFCHQFMNKEDAH